VGQPGIILAAPMLSHRWGDKNELVLPLCHIRTAALKLFVSWLSDFHS
jgi:hypothetical protein